jgi:hypothetical protein
VHLPFWISIAILSLVQGAIVAGPRALTPPGATPGAAPGGRVPMWARSRRWALVPPISVVGFVVIASAAEQASAEGLTYLALVCVPPLAALALGVLAHGARPLAALATPVLFALAWVDRSGLAGEAAAVTLSALSCVSLGVLLAALTPPRWLGAGLVLMAIADTVLVVSDLLQKPNNALNAAHPAAGLPRLQSALFGSAVMGYGDLFAAGVLGGLLAAAMGRRAQLRGAVFTAVIALAFDLLFFAVDELPATVPVALALLLSVAWQRRISAPRRSSREATEAVPGSRAARRPRERQESPAAR